MHVDPASASGDTAAPPGAGSDAAPVVRLIDVHKAFGNQVVLGGISLDLRPGGTTVILGPSGSGKSVLLKHIVGLLRPDKGEVHVHGVRVDTLDEEALTPVRKQVGFVFQLSALFDSMTIQENLEFPLIEHTDLSPDELSERAAEALAMVDLSGVQPKRPSELSGGQQRRVAFARAIMLRPSLVLYDEPTTGLDPVRADGICQLINKLRVELGVTGVCVTHDLSSARKVADRVVMLGGGQVIADGSFEQVAASTDDHVQNFLTGHYEPEEEPKILTRPNRRTRASRASA